jgi:parallel beta-helix repeat protein
MKTKRYLFACLCAGLIAVSLLLPLPARAANSYYVSPTGSDSAACSLSAPCKTIAHGLSKLVSGDTLYMRSGKYAERVNVSQSNITLAGYPGEVAVIDGTGISGSGWVWMLDITGNHDTFQDFSVTWPSAQAIWLEFSATYTTIRNLNVYNTYAVGINVWGNNTLIENSHIWNTNQSNHPAGSNGDWSAAISVGDQNPGHGGYGNNVTVRNNLVNQNYGEGIMFTYVDNGTISGNTTWNNWAANIYLDQCSYTTIAGNMVYYTTDRNFFRDGNVPAAGIEFSNEGIISYPVSHDVKIYNNIIVNAGLGINFWQGKVSGSALINDVIANNTIISNYSYWESMAIDNANGASHSNSIIANNIVSSPGVLASGYNASGITWSHNLWSRNPGFSGAGDVVGNPQLSNSGQSVDASIDPNWYTLTGSSPAIGKAAVLGDVLTDFFGAARDGSPDIGADETTNGVSTQDATPTPKFTATGTPKPNTTPTRTPTPRRTATPLPTTGSGSQNNRLFLPIILRAH